MFAGTVFKLGEKDYIIPALSMGQLRSGLSTKIKEHDDMAGKVGTDGGPSFYDVGLKKLPVIGEAIRRNYPGMTDQQLDDLVDMANVGPIWMAIMGASGFAPGEVRAVEQKPATTSGPSTTA